MYSQYTHINSINSLRYWIRISFNFKSNVEKDSSSLLLSCIKVYMCFIQRCTISQQPSYANCTPTHTLQCAHIETRISIEQTCFHHFFSSIFAVVHTMRQQSHFGFCYMYVWGRSTNSTPIWNTTRTPNHIRIHITFEVPSQKCSKPKPNMCRFARVCTTSSYIYGMCIYVRIYTIHNFFYAQVEPALPLICRRYWSRTMRRST